jgi:hypothetical protein
MCLTRALLIVLALIIYAFGSAMPVFTLSLVKSPTIAGQDSEANAQDYSIVMFAKTCGSLLGLPIMTISWAKGIGIGGVGLGMPYFLSAVGAIVPCIFAHLIIIGLLLDRVSFYAQAQSGRYCW